MAETKHEVRNSDYKPDNTVREKPVLTKVREWEHKDGTDCHRKDKPVYTPPDTLPGPCGSRNPWSGGCGSEEWRSKGQVYRDQHKRVVGPVKGQ